MPLSAKEMLAVNGVGKDRFIVLVKTQAMPCYLPLTNPNNVVSTKDGSAFPPKIFADIGLVYKALREFMAVNNIPQDKFDFVIFNALPDFEHATVKELMQGDV